jgi:hypothetical protein
MCYQIIIEIFTATGTIGAVIIGMAAIYHSNKNSRREINTEKIEEIFELIQSLSRNYRDFKDLYFSIEDLRNENKKNIETLSDYYKIRDEKFSFSNKQKIIADLSRLEVLSKCYTENSLLNKILEYEELMYSFSDFVFHGGSLHQELKWKNGFPTYEEYYSIIDELKKLLIDKIKRK